MGKRGIILLIAGALGLAVGLFLLLRPGPQPPPITQTLPDGSTLTLTGVKTGENVSFPHGSLLNRVLFQVLPTNGLRIGGRTLINRPNIATVLPQIKGGGLFLEFKTTSPTKSVSRSATAWPGSLSPLPSAGNYFDPASSFRFAIRADDGYLLYSPFSSRTNADSYRYAWIPVYQRMSKSLDASIEQLENVPVNWAGLFGSSSGTIETVSTEGFITRVDSSVPPDLVWHSIARFPVLLPAAREQKWKVESLPARRTFGDLEIQLDQILVTEQPGSAQKFDRFTGEMKFQVRSNIGTVPRWLAAPVEISDATGNTVVFAPFGIGVYNSPGGGLYQKLDRFPDPRFPWRVRLSVGRTTDFPQTNLATFNLPLPPTSIPITPTLRVVTVPGSGTRASIVLPVVTNILTTNLLGVPVTVVFTRSIVRFTLPENRTDVRLDLLTVVGDNGTRWTGGGVSRSTEREANFSMSQMRGATNFTVTLAIHPNYPAEFIIRPTLQPAR